MAASEITATETSTASMARRFQVLCCFKVPRSSWERESNGSRLVLTSHTLRSCPDTHNSTLVIAK